MPALWLEFTAVAALAITAHELTHYVTAWWFGHDPWFTVLWDGLVPTPAVAHDLGGATPWECRVTSLAPLTLAIPALVVYATGAHHVHPEGWRLLAMWALGAVPSPPDLWNAYHAADVRVYQDVWYGEHATHAAAEGIT